MKSAPNPGIFAIFAMLLGLWFPLGAAANPGSEVFLWAWQRPEDFSTIDPKKFSVAALACHATIVGDSVLANWRNQPLKVPPGTRVIPVVRIDVNHHSPVLGSKQEHALAEIVYKAVARTNASAIQIDFDALLDEREFYTGFLREIRNGLPSKVSISITSLASWCLFDNWIKDLPVDETVPMMFSLGRERQKIILYFSSAKDFLVNSCCESMGLSLEDHEVNDLMVPLVKKRGKPVRYYIFTRTAWTPEKIQGVSKLLQ